jgi:hypothetical protein
MYIKFGATKLQQERQQQPEKPPIAGVLGGIVKA